jgi:hypothetical protein
VPRLRPAPWAWLVPASAGLGGLAWLVATLSTEPRRALLWLSAAALVAGLLAAPVAAAETDPPLPVLAAAPRPLWRTHWLRWLAWAALAAACLAGPAWALAARSSLGLGQVLAAVLPDLALAGALSAGLASTSSVLGGAGAAGGVVLVMNLLAGTHPGFPLRPLDGPGDPLWALSRRWLVGAAVLLLALSLPGWARGGWWRLAAGGGRR